MKVTCGEGEADDRELVQARSRGHRLALNLGVALQPQGLGLVKVRLGTNADAASRGTAANTTARVASAGGCT